MSTVGSYSIPWQADASEARIAPRARSRTEAFPTGCVVSIDTNEFDEFNQCAAGWSVRLTPLDGMACRSTVFLAMTTSLQVALVQHTKGYSSQGANPAGAVSIAVPLDEARPMVHRGHGVGPMEMGLIRSGEGYECVCPSGTRFVIASVAQERVERYAADLWHGSDAWRNSPDRLRFVDSASRSRYLDACGRILSAVHQQPGLLGDHHAATLLEDAFLEGLFLNADVAPSCGHPRNRYTLARKAYGYLQDLAGDVPSIQQVCAVTGASYATLERGFRETYGMTPKAMMTAMRLSGARRTLLRPGPTTTVTAVALQWGFLEFGRFSVRYRQRFGEAPSQTLRRARGAPVAADHRGGVEEGQPVNS